jgi:hypothetical protein
MTQVSLTLAIRLWAAGPKLACVLLFAMGMLEEAAKLAWAAMAALTLR